ncbi:hypothetical protein CEE37_07590 [candidate division LCP-89 bacterium B3_LCP]|uniref:Secretion system C-terminal sorting domain-containing protein n=1 Tax=candidate division LCP-89 bacterium B3_LCP TaxID=2012998 RepID=A0A532V0X2_UNCL8|nr:MAG: hypothetical protein CEE37_07590 [candidate division LCP-89 bacterium B3_LCP]
MSKLNIHTVVAILLLMFTVGLCNAQYVVTIQYDDGNSAYYSGRPQPGDTCGVWFEPPSDCQILSGLFQFNDGMGGDALVYIWEMADDFDPENYYDNDEVGWPWGPQGSAPSPLGNILAGPIPYTFDDGGDWQEITLADYGYPPETLDVGMDPFFIGYVLMGTGAQAYYPSILGDAGDDRPYHSLCWLTEPSGMYAGESGWWAYGIDWMLRATVDVYGDPPPIIEGLEDPPDTYIAGPYTTTATITDMDSTGIPGSGQIVEARLIYSVDGGSEQTVIMVNTIGDTYVGDIPSVSVGSLINFRVEAEDNGGRLAIAPGPGGYNFTYLQPSGATILLVNDSGNTDGESFYMNALEGAGYAYDYWYIDPDDLYDMGYPGDDVINTSIYSTVIWFNGPAWIGSLPDNDADLSHDPVANFMDDGGSFFLSSSDYLGGAFNPDVWSEFDAIPGTFMYEYLKVADGWSDSHINSGTGQSQDTLYFGIAGDPISGDLTAGLYNHPDPNYNDYCNPVTGAETCFLTEINSESAGIRYSGDYLMVFLPWVLEACDDLNLAQTVLQNFMNLVATSIDIQEGSRYGIFGETPHPVLAEITDPVGIASASIYLSWDGGAYYSRLMTYVGNDQYSFTFNPPPGWSTLEYYIEAINNQAQIAESSVYECWTTGLEYLQDANLLYCSDQLYASGNYDTTITNVLDAMTYVIYQIWDVDEYGTPDYWTVLSNYPHCIWVGFGDWDEAVFPMNSIDNPFSHYLENGGDFLFSSEEMMGSWTLWTDYTFTAGEIAYDWLGVEHVQHDLCYDMIYLTDPVDPVCQGMTSPINLEDLDPGIPHYEDIITPRYQNAPTMFIYDNETAGLRDDDESHNMIHLCFCLFRLPPDQMNIFIPNVFEYFVGNISPLTVTLTPYNPPIQIPATGGRFDFNIAITNNSPSALTFDAWTMVTLPNGMPYGPLLGPINLTLPAGITIERDRSQIVPATAPAGVYSYFAYVGDYPSVIDYQDEFDFEKLTTGDGTPYSEWENSGESFDPWLATSEVEIPDSYALLPAYPNPFNPVANLTFALPEAAKVNLNVYDISGRLVAELVNGWRDAGIHHVNFNAENMASGIYITRIEAGGFAASQKMVLVK